ncbi:MAG: molybdopterin-synthase adenylyltransferase MoeB [Peptococcaceae bacterium]|nr:molybdopterin-synthase adenylyltransferase MoeB [Peptococcaceae bacterium]
MQFSEEEIKRYSRHILLPEVGGRGQEKIRAARVLLVGAGGLGSPAALYLAAAGVGRIGLVDGDVVDLSNLQRQILHFTGDLGRPKVESAREKLTAINPDLDVTVFGEHLTADNALDLIGAYDVVIDGSDNFPTRYLVNDACVFTGRPLIHGSIFRFEGQATTLVAEGGPCYRCLYPDPPPPGLVPSCQEAGVLGVLAGTIGVIQATETLKYILGRGRLLSGRLLVYDALDLSFREVRVRRDPACPVCGTEPVIRELTAYEQGCAAGA